MTRPPKRPEPDPVARDAIYPITSAPLSLAEDQQRRMRRYLIQMGARVACFIAAFVVWLIYPNPYLVIGLILASAVLPYFAVIGVNAGRESQAPITPHMPVVDHQHRLTFDETDTEEEPHDRS